MIKKESIRRVGVSVSRPQDPVRAGSWEGVRDGSKMPPPCLQVPFDFPVMGITLTPEELLGDEDCLYLNVFTPKVSGAYRGVLFIHHWKTKSVFLLSC